MEEIWKPLKFNKNLAISNLGRLKTIDTGQIWKPKADRNGYLATTIYHTNLKKSKSEKIHRLVAEMFLRKRKGKTHVNHKNFDKLDNRASNLEWCTMLENIAHYYENKFKYLLTDEQVLYVRKNIGAITPTKLSNELGVSVGYILGVANGVHYKNVHKEFIRSKRPSLPKAVNKIDEKGEVIESYGSVSEAARQNNVKLSYVQRVVSGHRGSIRGMIFSYNEPFKKVNRNKLPKSGKHLPVAKYTIGGELIEVYKNIAAAAKSIDVDRTTVKRAICGEQKTSGGFVFKYAPLELV